MKFGKNQTIAIYGFGITLLMNYALVIGDQLNGSEFADFSKVFVPLAIGVILGASAAVKIKGPAK